MTRCAEGQTPAFQSSSLWQKMAGLATGYFVCAWAGRFLSASGGTMVSYWLPAGLTVATLLLNETGDWPWLLLSIVPANILFDLLHDPSPNIWVILWFCVANLAQAGTGAWLTRRFLPKRLELASLRGFFGLMVHAGVLGSAVGAAISATMLRGFHLTPSLVGSLKIMWGGDMMAVLVLAPLVLVFFASPPKWPARRFRAVRLAEAMFVFGALLTGAWYVLVRGGGVNAPKAPLLVLVMWAGVRFGLRGATLTVFSLAIESAFLTTHYHQGISPAALATGEYVITLQLFVAVAALVGLVPAIILGERDRTLARLRESEEQFSKAFRASPDGMAISEVETGLYMEVNEGYCRLCGYQRNEMLDHTAVELGIWVNPADRARFVAELKEKGGIRNFEMRMGTRSGEVRMIRLSGEPIEINDGAYFVSVLHDVTDQIRAEEERAQAVAREQAARLKYTLQLIAAQEAERKRIAAELHDSMGQNLLLIKNLADLSLRSPVPETAREHLTSIDRLATRCIAEARQISHELRPYHLDHLGLTRALEAMLEQTAAASPIEFVSKFENVDDLFASESALNLYRIVQESLNNILKHSGARQVRLQLERDIHEVQLRIEDDGAGFDAHRAAAGKGMGLKNITERVRMLDGKWDLTSAPGQGTRLEVTIPIRDKPSGAVKE